MQGRPHRGLRRLVGTARAGTQDEHRLSHPRAAADGALTLLAQGVSIKELAEYLGVKIKNLAAEQSSGHHQALDLVGALVDLGDLRVTHHPFDWEIPGVAVATEELHRVGRHLHRHV